jgi:predicted RND superfamily exporter protein
MAQRSLPRGRPERAGPAAALAALRRLLARLGAVPVEAWFRPVLDRPRLVVALTIALSLLAGGGLRQLSFNPDSRLFFGPDDPERLALEAFEATFSRANNVVFVLEPRDGRVFTVPTLQAVAWLSERAWQVPYAQRVYSLTSEPHSFAKDDELVVEDLVPDPARLDGPAVEAARARAMGRDDLVRRLVSDKADVTAVMVLVNAPGASRAEVPQMAGFARGLAAEFRARHPAIEVHLTGGVIGDDAFALAGRRDLSTLVPLMVVLVALTLALGLRSLWATVATLAAILLSCLLTMGTAGWLGVVLNPATASAPVVILVLSLTTGVHIVTSACRELARLGARRPAVEAALAENAWPVLINSLTTVVGFLALGFSIAPPLQELGTIVSAGTLVALLLCFTFLPAVLLLLPIRASAEIGLPALRAALARLCDAVIARRRAVLAAGGLALLGLGFGMTRLTFDDDFIRYFDESYDFRRATDVYQNRLSGLHVLQFSLPAGEEGGVARPDYLQKVARFAEWFRGRPKVVSVSALSDLLERLNKNMHGDDPAFERLPESRELAAQYLLLYEMSLPPGHDLGTVLDVGRSKSKLTVVLANVSMDEVRELGLAGEAWLRANSPELAAPPTGLSIMYAYLSERNVRAMLAGTALGLVVISAMLVAALGSTRLGLLSLVPNFFPAFMAFGLWGYLMGEVNLAVSAVAVTTFGVVVDDTVHLMAHYRDARERLGLGPEDAIRHCYQISGVPCLLMAVALGLGFAVMALSGFAVTHQMGMLSAMTIVIAWLGDYLCLPPLLLWLERRL